MYVWWAAIGVYLISPSLHTLHVPFPPPFLQEYADAPFYSDSDDDSDKESQTSSKGSEGKGAKKKKVFVMDSDHRMLLRNCKPLLQSRNASVSLCVCGGGGGGSRDPSHDIAL